MVRRSRVAAAAATVALAVCTGCALSLAPAQTPTTPASSTQSSSATPSPTPTWSADQAAAIEAVTRFGAVNFQIGTDPAAFTKKQMTKLLEPVSGDEALDASVGWYQRLKEHGYHVTGEIPVLSVTATKPADDGRGIEVHIAQCQDQRQAKVIDKNGQPVTDTDFTLPEYNLRQYSVRKPPGEDAFRVFGYETINGACP